MYEEEKLLEQLERLKKEHRSLDALILGLDDGKKGGFDQIRLQRLKKQKLTLKDMILKLEGNIYPDIIA